MIKPNSDVFRVKTQKNIDTGTIVIDAGSVVIDNKWISYQGTTFSAQSYINSVVDGTTRVRFFKKRIYALKLMFGIDRSGSIQVVEGAQILYTTKSSVPAPVSYDIVPIATVLMVQDGSSDMVSGYKPLDNSNVTFFSGTGNVVQKNKKGIDGTVQGITGPQGLQGLTGIVGLRGLTGLRGEQGETGVIGQGITGPQGEQGSTGINWSVHIPFEFFF